MGSVPAVPPEGVEVGAVLAATGEPRSRVAVTSTPWVACGEPPKSAKRTPAHGLAAGADEHPAVGGVAHGVEEGDARVAVVGVVEARGPPNESRKLMETTTSGRWRRMAVARSRRSASRRLHQAVGVAEELDGVDADHRGRAPLLLLADAGALVGRQGVDARPRPR